VALAVGILAGAAGAQEPGAAKPVPPASAAPPEDGLWLMPAKNYAATRFSGLNQIDTGNVKDLQVAVTFSTGVLRGHEAAPIVDGTTMYIVTPYPTRVFALDLTKPGAPVKWSYEPKPAAAAQGVACCDVVNRGGVLADGRFFFATLDNRVLALDTASGERLWETRLGEINKGETMTAAPLVAGGKVLVGNSGGELGVRGWITALDEATGEIAWRAYSTGPDADVLIGPEFKPFYPQYQGAGLGVASWPPQQWQIGGGTVWGWITYEPDLNLVYYGTGNPGPWNPDMRPGDNLWTAGIFARDLETGQARWFYQTSPHDLFDYDGINEQILLDMQWEGQPRKVMVRPERNGYIYVLDRTTGEVLAADPFVDVTSSHGVDLETGRLMVADEKTPVLGRVVRDICPAAPGSKDWQPSAYSPETGLLYIPHQNLCMDWESTTVSYIAGLPYVGANVFMYAGHGGYRGEMLAWDPVVRKPAWSVRENFPVWSGALATAGDLVFYGTMEGWFKALDARSGELLWQFKTGSGIIGQPIAYRGPDGREYVAILSGVGGWAGAVVAGDLDVRDGTAALGFVGATADLPNATTKGGMLYVFALPPS
jgi:PQQ-dependent dehydrogenase (methanol/ethanol family)